MRRRVLGFLAALVLLSTQQAALLHAISHLADLAGRAAESRIRASVGSPLPVPDGEPCAECPAYAQVVAFAATTGGMPVLVTASVVDPFPPARPHHGASTLFAFRARAPPAVL
jgi:hypothetical protein